MPAPQAIPEWLVPAHLRDFYVGSSVIQVYAGLQNHIPGANPSLPICPEQRQSHWLVHYRLPSHIAAGFKGLLKMAANRPKMGTRATSTIGAEIIKVLYLQ